MEDRKKILLVEDELFIRELYQRVLQQANFIVMTAVDGAEGLTLAQEKPDLILLDIMLPKINGIEVLKKLKEDPSLKDIPVVLITNLGEESIINEAFKIGAQGYIMKMRLTPYEIVNRVKEFLENPKHRMDVTTMGLD